MEDYKNISDKEIDRLLDEALKSEPDFSLPSGFAEQLTVQLSTQSRWNQYMQEFLLYLSLFILLGGLAIATLFWMETSTWTQMLTFIKQQYSFIIGINILLIFILFADRVLLRYFNFKIHEKRLIS